MLFPLNHFIPYSSITSSEVASLDVTFDLVIDKLLFRLNDEFLIDDLHYHFDKNQISSEPFHEGFEYGIIVESFIIFYNEKTKRIYKIVTNPNYYSNFHDFRKRYSLLLPKQLRKMNVIHQVDFTINFYNLDYVTFLKILVIKQKQSFSRMKSNRTENRTVYMGAGSAQSKAYNKKNKIEKSRHKKFQELKFLNIQSLIEKSDKYKHWSELEVQLTGEKLPTRTTKGFLNAIQSKDFNPLKNHFLANYGIKELSDIDPKMTERYYQIREAINCLGIFEAKKLLNKSKNFERDFNKIVFCGTPLKLEDYFHPLLEEYLQKGNVDRVKVKKNKKLNLSELNYTFASNSNVGEKVWNSLFGSNHGN